MQILADPVPDANGVLANATAENERIEAIQSRRKPAQLTPDAEHEIVDSLFGLWRARPPPAPACRR